MTMYRVKPTIVEIKRTVNRALSPSETESLSNSICERSSNDIICPHLEIWLMKKRENDFSYNCDIEFVSPRKASDAPLSS
jgi:hypothetical protein